MLGNAAIARGFLEAGLQFAASYPGTPSTEITEALAYAYKTLGWPVVQWSVNEKVALESALGAAIAGLRSFAGMKHVGLNVASDPFFSSAYLGVEGALVVVSADDPWMWSSQNEQDNRWYGVHAYVFTVEPKGVQDAKEAACHALEWSAMLKRPVLLRITTRIAHSRTSFKLGPLKRIPIEGRFEKNPQRWTLIPEFARRHRLELLRYWEELKAKAHQFPLNVVEGEGDVAVLASGIGYRYAKEALEELGLEAKVFGLSTPVPLPDKFAEELSQFEKVVVVEEGEPVVELQLRAALQELGSKAKVFGKTDGSVRLYGELDLEDVKELLAKVFGVEYGRPKALEPPKMPPRPPVLCPGCPYRSYFYALKRAVNRLRVEPVYSGDIGCYSLGINKPFEVQDIIIDMGASIGAGIGLSKALKDRVVISIIGDSTFFHSGMTALADAVYNRAPLLVIVLDNFTTAMTGHQPHPGIGVDAAMRPAPRIEIESVVRGLGVEKVVTVDAFNILESQRGTEEALRYVLENKKPAVVIARGACALVALAQARKRKVEVPKYYVDESKCTACGICYTAFNCPAILKREDGKAWIDPALCVGCAQCEQICPFGAFVPEKRVKEWERLLRTARPG
ncbi:MAG: indolepyruvate ferredoxin oxidoreductase subunit alpha [Crenarchaeota archaeon]|nr:indolepyruvate ferredoxin oxidoreductase subunit alpha [Thermoproteota archaeon]